MIVITIYHSPISPLQSPLFSFHYPLFLGAFCGTPLGFKIRFTFIPSVRYATLGFGV